MAILVISTLVTLAAFFALPIFSSAHVGYVLEEGELALKNGSDARFLLAPLFEIRSALLVIGTGAILAAAYFILYCYKDGHLPAVFYE